ncbi:glucokinase, partial [Desulfobulbus sp. F1]|nr:glucokinase [Desulfobulbus sp. F1]
MNNILTGDIGGTNSRFAFFAKNGDLLDLKGERKEKSNNFDSFDSLLCAIRVIDSYYDASKFSNFVVAVPGAVTSENLIHLPYVRWKTIDQAALKKKYPHAVFINDFVAQAYGCLTEATKNAVLITGKERQEQGDIAVIGAGTGTGHCVLKKIDAESYACIPSEAGHIPFPFLFDDEIESGFRGFLIATKDDDDNKRNNLIPVCNDVVSGPGLSRLHRYLTKKRLSPSEVIEEIKSQPDSKTTEYFA